MQPLLRPLSVTLRKRPVQSRWADFEWEAGRVLDVIADAQPSVDDNEIEFQGLTMDLHPSEGEGYWLNLTSPEPCLFVMWRQDEDAPTPLPVVVTASYNEAGRMLDAGERVDRVAMPPAIRAWVQTFSDEHYKPEVRKKVRRNDPFKDGAFKREVPKEMRS